MKPKKSLNKGIYFIFLSIWFIIFVMQVIYIYVLYRNALNDAHKQFSNSILSACSILEEKLHIDTQLSKSLSSDAKAAKYLQCEDIDQRQRLWRSITSPLQNAYNLSSEQFYAFSFNNEREIMDHSEEASQQLLQVSHNANSAFIQNKEPLSFYKPSDTPFTDMFFFAFNDVQVPKVDNVGMNFLGTVAVAGKINTAELMRRSDLNENVRLVLSRGINEESDIVLAPGLDDAKPFIVEHNIGTTGWKLRGSYTVKTPYSTGALLLILETVFMTGLFLLMQQFVRINIFAPLNQIFTFLGQYSLTSKKQRIKLQNQTEIGIVADKINEMIDNIEYLSRNIVETQQKLYESELAQKDASLYALQSQLNPHFMYNTLDCICGIANVSNVPQISDVVAALAKMLRYNLSEGSDVSLMREIEIAENYLTIMRIRRPNCFTSDFQISEEAKNTRCLKMLLQPIIENTFKHGFNSYITNGKIIISAATDADCLLITIFDNGCGIPREKLSSMLHKLDTFETSLYASSNGSIHVGLANIQNRIRLNYGNDFGLSIESEEGSFTKITLRLPKIPETDPNDR